MASSEKLFPDYLVGELRSINAHLPRARKSLDALLHEERPHVVCGDGSRHLFKKKELHFLAGILSEDEQQLLMLPILLEVSSDQGGVVIRSREGLEIKVLEAVLDMALPRGDDRIIIFRPQVNVVRRVLKTTTQYVFL
ncbi:MAG: DUF61 family protein [Deltaproteobacteria bacterium]|nr:DUF61 family protein [Deltaproteobacteria bacterium]